MMQPRAAARPRAARAIVFAFLALLAACGPDRDAAPDAAAADAESPAAAAALTVSDAGLATPESVLHEPDADVYLVSNINGNPLEQDDNGFISRLTPEGTVAELRWIDGAAAAITLNAPKGLALKGDTLFVADIDVVRMFDRTSGAPLGERPVPGATFLNDMDVGPDGVVYVADSGLQAGEGGFADSGTDAIYRFGPDGTAIAVATGADLGRPNGLVVDTNGIIAVAFGTGDVYHITPSGERLDVPNPPAGTLDGVVRLDDGSLLLSSWEASAVYRLSPDGEYRTAVGDVTSPADIGYDHERGRVLIPLFNENAVVIRQVP